MSHAPSHPIVLLSQDLALLQRLSRQLIGSPFRMSHAARPQEIDPANTEVVLTDYRPDSPAFRAFQEAFAETGIPVVLIRAESINPSLHDASDSTAMIRLSPSADAFETITALRQALYRRQMATSDASWRDDLIGQTSVFESMLEQAERIAASDIGILLQGPDGTEKEQLAHAIHKASKRAPAPFLQIDCSGQPAQQLSIKLFGNGSSRGLIHSANGGTLFLNEINELSRECQHQLLSLIRKTGLKGSNLPNVRIIAASTENLEQVTAREQFDADLYNMLSLVSLELPALQDRPEDIPLLARHYLTQATAKTKRKVRGLSPGAMHLLAQAAWPGNLVQLEEVIREVCNACESGIIPENLVAQALETQEQVIPSFNDARLAFEKHYLTKLLRITEGNVTHAARIAQRNRTDFYKLLSRHDLEAADFKTRKRKAKASPAPEQPAVSLRKIG